MRYRLINPVYTTGITAGVTFQPAVVDGCWVGAAEVDVLPDPLPRHLVVIDQAPETDESEQGPPEKPLSKQTKDELIALATAREIPTDGLTKEQLIAALTAAAESE